VNLLPGLVEPSGRRVSNGERIIRWILIGISAVVVTMLLLSLARVGLIAWFYSTVKTWTIVRLGFDDDLAGLVAVTASGIFAIFLPTIAWILVGRRQVVAASLIIGSQALACALVYSIGKDVCFDRRTGASLCFYADTPIGRFFSRTPGADPKFGVPLRPFTTVVATGKDLADSTAAKGARDSAAAVKQARDAADSTRSKEIRDSTAAAKRDEAARVERARAAARSEEERRASYLSATNLPGRVDFIVCTSGPSKERADALATALVKYLRTRGKTASSVVFSAAFVSGGAFDSFFEGRGGADLLSLPVSTMGKRLFFARIDDFFVKPGTSAEGLVNASGGVTFRILSSSDGSVVDGFYLSAIGAGTSSAGAITGALDNILNQLSQHGY
jgi:hypothetical protein